MIVDLFSLTVPTGVGMMIGVGAGRLLRKYKTAPAPIAKNIKTPTITALELSLLVTLVLCSSET
jgi:hypothetical protein